MKKAALSLIIFALFLCGCKEAETETTVSSVSDIQQEEPESVEVREEEKTPDEPKAVTVEDLEEAKKYTIVDTYSDDLDSDYFFYGNFGESDAELFGRTDYEGYYVRIGDDIYPVDYYIGRNEPSYMIAADFDDDGNTEYGFDSNDGWGTGFYTEALIIVDPDEEKPICIFNRDNIVSEDNNLFEHVKTEVNESDGTLTYWLEDEGKELYKGSICVNTEWRHITDESTCTGLAFGDIFTIEYEENKWTFIADGGTVWSDTACPDYEKCVKMSATLTYKDGTISYEDVSLCSKSDEKE